MTTAKNSPLITIIIAVFNGAATLQQCINSVVAQSYAIKELIIIDGGSTDGSVDLLKANDHHITYWLSEPDHGIYNAWNKALIHAKGEWIYFLGADDYFYDAQVLEVMAKQLAIIPPHIHIAYCQVMLIQNDESDLYALGQPWVKIKQRFRQVMCIPHQGVMHRRSLFELHGKFNETFRIAGDYELLLRELKTNDAQFIPELILTATRLSGISSAPANTVATMLELRRAQQLNGLPFPGMIWLLAMLRVYIRLLLWLILGEKRTRQSLDFGRRIIGKPPYWTKT